MPSAPLITRPLLLALALAAAALIGAAHAAAPGTAVAWLAAAGDADVERAFAQARAEKKPLLLYWGAAWCPPCNQLKATLFNRADFAERAKDFVAVNIDGDLPGAQKLGGRFKVRGYPTLILMGADGAEITRLPGEVDAPQVMKLLQMGLSGGRPVKAVLADALAGKALGGPEWRMLAYYAWDTDEAQMVPAARRANLLAQLARACPASEAESATRLLLKALAESGDADSQKPGQMRGLKPDAALRQRVQQLLADPVATRAQMDVVVNFAADISLALAPTAGAERRALAAAFDSALSRLQTDASLSRGDQLSALGSRVMLARQGQPKDARHPKLDAALLQQVRAQVARDDRQISDAYERQAVVTGGASVLADAGLWADSDALLKANLARSHSPYYLMSQLAGNARKLGQPALALQWYQQAYDKSEGPATRLQWGASYFKALVDLAPQDAPRIEQVARQMFAEAGRDRAAFHERSARALEQVGRKLADWAGAGAKGKNGQDDATRQATLRRLQEGPDGLDALCAKLDADPAQRAKCDALRKTVAAPA